MNAIVNKAALTAAIMLLAVTYASAAAKTSTVTGTVSDAMCGAKHTMEGTAADCTRECVAKGSRYALIVGDKVYALDTSDKATLTTLDKRAGGEVTVKGDMEGDIIHVTSVLAAK